MRRWITSAALLMAGAAAVAPSAQEVSPTARLREGVRQRVELGAEPGRIPVGEGTVHASRALSRFYVDNFFRPVWVGDDGPNRLLRDLIGAIRDAAKEALEPDDYHLSDLELLLSETAAGAADARAVDLELLATDAFLLLGSHLLSGRTDPETRDPMWITTRREGDLAQVLSRAVESGDIAGTLRSLTPAHPGYPRLQRALATYRRIRDTGGWVTVSDGPKLEPSVQGPRVIQLRERLAAEGFSAEATGAERSLFDAALHDAVIAYQELRGLDTDGVVGPKTLQSLNVPADERVRQIAVNLERWRWLPQDLGDRYVLVNIADFRLFVVAGTDTLLAMKVIAGRDYRQTPVFSAEMTYLVLSPYWTVPPTIAAKDVLPAARKDPGYFARQNMKIFLGWGADAHEVDPFTVDWGAVRPGNNAYRFRQEPGRTNALGLVKFMFPNKFKVYLHDTPTKDLFGKAERAFSSGCIRIEEPFELAEYLLRGDARWSPEAIRKAAESGREQTVPLPGSIPVHLLYWTAWVDRDERVHFRRDIYNRDGVVWEALREPPPEGR